MNNRFFLSALTVGVLASGSAYAQQDTTKADAIFDQLDINGDQQLSADELAKLPEVMHQRQFARADTNGDGKIEQSEFMAQANQRAERMFKHLDANNDGKIEPDEMKMPHHGQHRGHGDSKDANTNSAQSSHHGKRWRHRPSPQRMLTKMDTDGNGSVSKAEWEAAAAKWHDHRGEMHKLHDETSDND